MMKNRVVPVRSPSTDINNDPFFTTSNAETSKGKKFGKDKFFTKEKNYDRSNFSAKRSLEGSNSKNFKNKFSGIDAKSRNIKKGNNFHNNKFAQNKDFHGKIYHKKIDNFKKVEEDAEYKAQAKNTCRELEKFQGVKTDKKPFDKKKYRLQKYSKKYKLEQWEEKRKKVVLKEYYQQVKDERPKMDVQKIYEECDSDNEGTEEKPRKNYVQNPDYVSNEIKEKKEKKSTKKKVYDELERIKREKEEKKEEMVQKKKDKEEALKMYKQKKVEKHKKLNKKTKRGQPVMKGRIEMLLEQIQNS